MKNIYFSDYSVSAVYAKFNANYLYLFQFVLLRMTCPVFCKCKCLPQVVKIYLKEQHLTIPMEMVVLYKGRRCVLNVCNVCAKDLQSPAEEWCWAESRGEIAPAGASRHCGGAEQKTDSQTSAEEKTRRGAFHTDPSENSSVFRSLIVCVMIFKVFDDAENLAVKVTQLAKAVQEAKHVVIYTGAGISTVCRSSL